MIISSFVRDGQEDDGRIEEENQGPVIRDTLPVPITPALSTSSSSRGGSSESSPVPINNHFNGGSLIFCKSESPSGPPTPATDAQLLGSLQSLAYLYPSEAFGDDESDLLDETSVNDHRPPQIDKRAEILASFPADVHARFFFSSGQPRLRAVSSPLKGFERQGLRSRARSLPPRVKPPFLLRTLASVPSPVTNRFLFDNRPAREPLKKQPLSPSVAPVKPEKGDAPGIETARSLVDEPRSSPLSISRGLDVLADVAGERSPVDVELESQLEAIEILPTQYTPSSPTSHDEWDTTEPETPKKPDHPSRQGVRGKGGSRGRGSFRARGTGRGGALSRQSYPTGEQRFEMDLSPISEHDTIQTRDDKSMILARIKR